MLADTLLITITITAAITITYLSQYTSELYVSVSCYSSWLTQLWSGFRIRPSVWKALKLGLGGSPLPKSEDASHSVAAATSSAGDDDNDNVDAESPAGGPAAEPAVGEEEGTVGGGAMPDAGEVGGMDDAAKAEATKPAADGATPGYAS